MSDTRCEDPMSEAANPRPARWGLIVLGLLLAPTSLATIIALVAQLSQGHVDLDAATVLVQLLIFGVLGSTLVAGAHLLAHGTGGERGALTSVYGALWLAFVSTGLLAVFLLGRMLLAPPVRSTLLVLSILALLGSGWSFCLAWALRRLVRGDHVPQFWQNTPGLWVATLPLLLLILWFFLVMSLNVTCGSEGLRSRLGAGGAGAASSVPRTR